MEISHPFPAQVIADRKDALPADEGGPRGLYAGVGTRALFAALLLAIEFAIFRAGQESEIPNFKGSYLGRFPLVSADFWTSDHLSERSRRVDAFPDRARAEHSR